MIKLPRWLVIVLWLLPGIATLGTSALSWLMWPKRTSQHFYEQILVEDQGAVRKMIAGDNDLAVAFLVGPNARAYGTPALQFQPMTLIDALMGNREFIIDRDGFSIRLRACRSLIVAHDDQRYYFDAIMNHHKKHPVRWGSCLAPSYEICEPKD